MNAIRHVSIFLPRSTPFYRALLRQMRRGFEEAGVETSGHCGLLEEPELLRWCAERKPSVVFEMNRPRVDVPFLPKDVLHVVWVVDFLGRGIAAFRGSEITYLFGSLWVERYPYDGFHRWFGPGACDEDYAYGEAPFLSDGAFVGHVPNPWTEEEFRRNVATNGHHLAFGDLVTELHRHLRRERANLKCTEDTLKVARRIVAETSGGELRLDDPVLTYDIGGRTFRQMDRCDMMDRVIDTVESLRLFGPENWLRWPRYRPHYRGFLESPAEIRAVYQSSRVNFHEGNGVHFRSMDCMSSGGLLFHRETPRDETPAGIKSFFEPGVHYVPFDLENLPEVYARYRSDPDACARIRRAAAEHVRSAHTWRHRAASVLEDLKKL